jgi:hypothetical protein
VHRGGLASKPSAPVLSNPSMEVDVHNPTTEGAAATPAAGSRHVGMCRRIVTSLRGEVICDECGTAFDGEYCPTCAQRRRRRAGLEVAVETYGGRRVWVTMERADDDDGGGWWPSRVRPVEGEGDEEPEGWPW